jgi:glucose-1-phosphate adenylyltransferase
MKPKVICVIMGGGRGTRLHPLTKLRCKPAVPLAGKYRIVDIPISNCLNSGYNRIFVLTQFNTASLHRHIQEAYKFDPFGGGFVDILSAEQTESGDNWYQGTADAVRQNLHHFDSTDEDLFLILSGDQLYRMNLEDLVRQHRETKAEVTIAGKAVGLSQVEGLGIMRVRDDLAISEFVEKPKDPEIIKGLAASEEIKRRLHCAEGEFALANMGIYVFNRKTLLDALNSSATDFGKEIIPGLLGKVDMRTFLFDDYWEDIGTVRSFFNANLQLTDTVPPFNFFDQIHPVYTRARYLPAAKFNNSHLDHVIAAGGAIVDHAQVRRSVIGVRARVGEGSRLENVVMMGADFFETREQLEANLRQSIPHLGVGRNCDIKNSIIDKNARIGDNVILDPQHKADSFEKGDIQVRDGVLIVTKGAIIPSGTVFR